MSVTMNPPADADAPIQVGIGGVDVKPSEDGTWEVPDEIVEELRRRGWVDATTTPDAPPASPEA